MYPVLVNFFDLFLSSEFYTTEFHALPVLLFSHRMRKFSRETGDESKPYVKKPPKRFHDIPCRTEANSCGRAARHELCDCQQTHRNASKCLCSVCLKLHHILIKDLNLSAIERCRRQHV